MSMAKKKFKLNFKVSYDAPVTLTFVLISAIIFLLSFFLAKAGKADGLEKIFTSPTAQTGALPFIVKQPFCFIFLEAGLMVP